MRRMECRHCMCEETLFDPTMITNIPEFDNEYKGIAGKGVPWWTRCFQGALVARA
jgi:hypothetical protein